MTTVAIFDHHGEFYMHKIFCDEDDRVECRNEDNEIVLVFTANCDVYTPKTKRLYGSFSMTNDSWLFRREHDGYIVYSEHGDDLIRFETDISILYIDDAFF